MAPRLARAALVLLCALAVVHGTALFPAAFDVELHADGPAAPTGPGANDDLPGDDPSGTGPADDPTETQTDAATPTESSASGGGSTPVPPSQEHADGGAGDGGGGIDGLFSAFSAGLLLLFLVTGVGGLLVLFGERDGDRSFALPNVSLPWSVPTLSLRRIPQLTTLLVITAASGLVRIAEDATRLGRLLVGSVASAVGPVASVLGRALVSLPRTTAALVAAPVRVVGSSLTLIGGLGFVRGGLSRPSFGTDSTPSTDARAESDAVPAADDGTEPAASVLDAWRSMADRVPVRNPEATTPVEYARKATAIGLPEGPVARLTDLFREVRYGGRADSTDRVSAARRALDALTGGED